MSYNYYSTYTSNYNNFREYRSFSNCPSCKINHIICVAPCLKCKMPMCSTCCRYKFCSICIKSLNCGGCNTKISELYSSCRDCEKVLCGNCKNPTDSRCISCDDKIKVECKNCSKKVYDDMYTRELRSCSECNKSICIYCDKFNVVNSDRRDISLCSDSCLKLFVQKNSCYNCSQITYSWECCNSCKKKVCSRCRKSCPNIDFMGCSDCVEKHVNKECEKCKEFGTTFISECSCRKHDKDQCRVCWKEELTTIVDIFCSKCSDKKSIPVCTDHASTTESKFKINILDVNSINTKQLLNNYQKIVKNFCSFCKEYVCIECCKKDSKYFVVYKNKKIKERIKLCTKCVDIDNSIRDGFDSELGYKIVVTYLFNLC